MRMAEQTFETEIRQAPVRVGAVTITPRVRVRGRVSASDGRIWGAGASEPVAVDVETPEGVITLELPIDD